MQRTVKTVQMTLYATTVILFLSLLFTYFAHAMNYSAGTYGTCTYGTCSISLTTSGSVAVNVVPVAGSSRCTVSSDSVTATTDSSTGYTVSMTDSDTSNTLNGPSSIATSSSTSSSPTTLDANKWGYRVDGVDGFGPGPTSSISSGVTPTVTFAGIPLSSGTPATIRTTSTPDTGTVSTPVWYGICADTTILSGSYTDNITYTALIN